MPAPCPSCGQENPAGARFCFACGTPLAVAASGGRRERKTVSVLFCDLAGFTAASEFEDPEDVQRRLHGYHEQLRRHIESFGGTVEKFIGDAVMAVFGAPVAHEDDAERAVRAALRIIEALAESAAGALAVRIGVNTGEVVVDLDARPERGEGFVTGDVVNTAARIQSAAPVDGIAVGESTYRATARVFEFEPLAPLIAEGKSEPVVVWRAIRARGRFGTDLLRGSDSAFIGRDVERALLQGLFSRSSRDSSVQLVTIVGEPGVGKSRLVADLGQYIDELSDLVTWRQGRCLPYGEGIAFWALGELLKAHAGVYDSDTPENATAKVEAVLPPGEERAWLRARLLPLIGIDSGGTASREESFAAWRRFLEWITEAGPAVLVVEDLHWADAALLEFIAYFAEWAGDVPLLLICTARPELYENNAGWAGGIRNATSINLGPLSPSEARQLVASLLERSRLADRAESAILERIGGNPLYAEEFVRLLAERALPGDEGVDEALRAPASVQALMAARLDTLSPERKALLQDAAVVGKVFWAGTLAHMSGSSPRDVELALHELTRKELVRRSRTSSIEGEAEYSFWHGLLRDVAYEQIPRGERARRHASCAEWLAELAGDGLGDAADIIAHHYGTAFVLCRADGDDERASAYEARARTFLVIAGQRALPLNPSHASDRFARALALTPADDPAHAEIGFQLAQALDDAGEIQAAAEAFERAIGAFRAAGRAELHAQALGRLSRVARARGEARFVALAQEAVTLLEPRPPGPVLVDAIGQLAIAELWAGLTEQSIATSRRALALAAELGLAPVPRILGYLGDAIVERGDAAGLVQMEQAIELTRAQQAAGEASDSWTLAVLVNNLALARLPIEGPARALEEFDRAAAISRTRGLVEVGGIVDLGRAAVLFQLGRAREAISLALETAAYGRRARHLWLEMIGSALSTRYLALLSGALPGDFDLDGFVARLGIRVVNDAAPDVFGTAALAHRLRGNHAEALRLLAEFATVPEDAPSTEYPRLLPFLVREALALGDVELAERLREGVPPLHWLHRLALDATAAAIAEARGSLASAAAAYAAVAEEWLDYGDLPERAYALHGSARCRRSQGAPDPDLETAAAEAFRAIGFQLPDDLASVAPASARAG